MAYSGLSLEGKVALVTGSARGIGACLALGLAEAGADVAVSDMARGWRRPVAYRQRSKPWADAVAPMKWMC